MRCTALADHGPSSRLVGGIEEADHLQDPRYRLVIEPGSLVTPMIYVSAKERSMIIGYSFLLDNESAGSS